MFDRIPADKSVMTIGRETNLVTWSAQYSVGIARMDSEHQKLIGLVNDLYSAMLEGRGRDVVGPTLDGMATYTVAHFANEERLMRVHSYPDYEPHKAEHDRLAQQVKHLQDEFREGKPIVSREVMRFLQHWLVDHIVGVDKKYTGHLRAAGVK
jgi:hemerythrin-like metal-binding protein